MDLQLPGMDGLELTRKLKANPALSGVLIVALTSYAMKGDEEKALVAGCDGYVTKPIDTRRFPEQVAELLPETPMKILVVDDLAVNRKLFRVMLATAGHEGVGGLPMVSRLSRSCAAAASTAVLSDVLMPRMGRLPPVLRDPPERGSCRPCPSSSAAPPISRIPTRAWP